MIRHGTSKISPSKEEFTYYPETTDSNFYEKIYKKKEYYINRQKKLVDYENKKGNDEMGDIMVKMCQNRKKRVEKLEHQKLIKNLVSPHTPYKNLLIMHGTGSGKTFTAVSVAEGFKSFLERVHNRLEKEGDPNSNEGTIYIIGSQEAQSNFKDELLFKTDSYITQKEKNELIKLSKEKNEKSRKLYGDKLRRYYKRLTTRMNGGYYKFLGYRDFQNRTIGEKIKLDVGYKKDSRGKFVRKRKEPGIKTLNNCIVIVDEAHNLVNSNEVNDYGRAISQTYKKSKGVRLLLLTATPITHRPREIIRLLNLIRLDSNEPEIKYNDILNNNDLMPGSAKILGKKSKGYVSYLRGYNPYTYPTRVDMGKIPKSNKIKYTKLIRCEMSEYHYDTYEKHHKTGKTRRVDESLLHMVFPNPYSDKYGLYRIIDIDGLRGAPHSFLKKYGIRFKKLPDMKYQITGDFLKKENLKKYSSKFHELLKNVDSCTNKNNSHNFIYTRLVKGAGSLLLKEILLNNGYMEYKYDLSSSSKDKEGNIESKNKGQYGNIKCHYCGTLGKNHKNYFSSLSDKKDNELKKSGETMHTYMPAKFMMIESRSNEEKYLTKNLVDEFNSEENRDTSKIKIIIGSRVARETIDLRRVMNVHITTFDDNFATLEQVIGRGARHCSHADLEKDKRIVKIYRYVNSLINFNKTTKLSEEEER